MCKLIFILRNPNFSRLFIPPLLLEGHLIHLLGHIRIYWMLLQLVKYIWGFQIFKQYFLLFAESDQIARGVRAPRPVLLTRAAESNGKSLTPTPYVSKSPDSDSLSFKKADSDSLSFKRPTPTRTPKKNIYSTPDSDSTSDYLYKYLDKYDYSN